VVVVRGGGWRGCVCVCVTVCAELAVSVGCVGRWGVGRWGGGGRIREGKKQAL